MRLRALRVERLPGLNPGFELTDVAPGVNVVVGPNASGKSSVLRALEALLYPERHPGEGVVLDAVFEDAGGALQASRVGARVSWRRDGREVPPPELPDAHLLGCFRMGVEDLGGRDATDAEIERRLHRALRGGYDLDAVRTGLVPASSGQREARELRSADDALNRLLGEREALAGKQAAMARWEALEQEGREARQDAEAHEAALALIEARSEARRARAELQRFPDAMERLSGTEVERLERLRHDLGELDTELAGARGEEEAALRRLERTGLERSALTGADLEEHGRLLNDLRSLESQRAGLEERRADAGARLRQAADGLGARPGGERPHLDPDTLSAVDRGLDGGRALRAERRALEQELDRLPDGSEPGEPLEGLREARAGLSGWLAAAPAARWTPRRALGLALALGGGGAAALLAGLAGASATLSAVLGLGLVAGLALMVASDPGARERTLARERLRRSGLGAPQRWEADAVRARLAEVEGELARAEVLRVRLELRAEAERRAARLAEREDAFADELARLAERVGFAPSTLDAGVERWLRLLEGFDRADAEVRRLDARLADLEQRHERERRALAAFLAEHGEAPRTAEPEAEALDAHLGALAARLSERDGARAELQRTRGTVERAERDRARLQGDLAALFREAGLDPEGPGGPAAAERELRARLERLAAYRSARQASRDADLTERLRRDALTGRPELVRAADAGEAEALREALADLRRRVEEGEQATRERAATAALVREAERGRALERARAARQSAADALHDRWSEALQAEAAAFLLDEVEREHEQSSQPASLRRAREWFRRFTRHQFELVFDAGDGEAFAARETASGERRSLAELSTGTRSQLLLAVRVAFAGEAERGKARLPLFLDEALTTADVERFRAVSESLSLLARDDGRQLFYLTARPDDVPLWQAAGSVAPGDGAAPAGAHVIDIARLRGRGRTVSTASALRLPPRPPLPAPDGSPPERYALAVGVPAIDPWQPASACHPFHLLRDDLPLLHRLLRAGVTSVGALGSLLEGPAAEAVLSDEEAQRLRQRKGALEAFLEGWRTGRGRPVDREALLASGAVSSTFLDRVDALAQRLQGDAAALLEALAGGEVARFRSKDREQLESWLREEGYLDDRPRHGRGELTQRVLAALAGPSPAVDPTAATQATARAETGAGVEARLSQAAGLTDAFTTGIRAGHAERAPEARGDAAEGGAPA